MVTNESLLNNLENSITTILRSQNINQISQLLIAHPRLPVLLRILSGLSRPKLKLPAPGASVPANAPYDIVMVAGSPNATYTINVINSNGQVVHSCSNIPIDPNSWEGVCRIPANTLTPGESYYIEVIENDTTYYTLGWFIAS